MINENKIIKFIILILDFYFWIIEFIYLMEKYIDLMKDFQNHLFTVNFYPVLIKEEIEKI